jgi:hypothetical protein
MVHYNLHLVEIYDQKYFNYKLLSLGIRHKLHILLGIYIVGGVAIATYAYPIFIKPDCCCAILAPVLVTKKRVPANIARMQILWHW